MAFPCWQSPVKPLRVRWALLFGIFLGLGLVVRAAAAADALPEKAYEQAIADSLGTDGDRTADATRHPLQFLRFAQVRPGMRVLDVATGGGYTAQLLALAVGPGGKVWAQADHLRPALFQRLEARLQANLIPVEKTYDDPVPEGAHDLDLVTIVLNYHDITYLPVDREKMDRRLFEALKSGGHLVLIDHSSKPGQGTSVAKNLHRIDEATVKEEFKKAGFVLEGESDYLRNPADPRDQPFFKAGLATDKFALRFVKP